MTDEKCSVEEAKVEAEFSPADEAYWHASDPELPPSDEKCSVEGGKYIFQTAPDGHSVDVMRHGEYWVTITGGSKAVHALCSELREMRALAAEDAALVDSVDVAAVAVQIAAEGLANAMVDLTSSSHAAREQAALASRQGSADAQIRQLIVEHLGAAERIEISRMHDKWLYVFKLEAKWEQQKVFRCHMAFALQFQGKVFSAAGDPRLLYVLLEPGEPDHEKEYRAEGVAPIASRSGIHTEKLELVRVEKPEA